MMSQSVTRRLLTSGTVLTPKHSSPHCEAEWGMSRVNGQANGFENLNCHRGPVELYRVQCVDPRHCSRVCCTHPIRIRRNRNRNGVRGSMYCSASLCAADYDHHK